MNIGIVRVKEEQKETLANLLELYQYDFSEFDTMDVDEHGLYGYPYLDCYWTEENRYAYFIKADGKLAGFAMVCGHCYVSETAGTLFMSEFFVMRKYRKKGIGSQAACEILKMHPGKWELTVHPNNPGALVFWKKAAGAVARGEVRIVKDVPDVYEDGLATAYLFEVCRKLYLKKMNLEDAEKEYEYITNLPADETGFTNNYYGVGKEEFMNKVLPELIGFSEGVGLPEGYVPETDFFLWDDDEIAGLFRVRHYLNEFLRNGAGHIGYGIKKEYRGRGYATEGLRLAIEKAKEIIPEDEIYMSVQKGNPASLRAQEKNGAYIHHEDEEEYYTRIRLSV